ncbi:MAG: hypothetical protein U0531_01905 [Dehalococcoidia bacterium]
MERDAAADHRADEPRRPATRRHAGGIDLEVECVSREHTHVSCDDQRRGVAWEAGLHGDLRRLRECLKT